MILAILILAAFIILLCIVAGIIFFLSRRLAARLFPNWQWGHPDEDQLIRLNLKM
jgi:predicted small integral membrane protein